MSYHIFLDDERMPGQVTWVELPSAVYEVVRNFVEFTYHILEFGLPKFVSFDHDLGEEHYAVMQKEVEHFTYNDGDLTKTFSYGDMPTGFDCAKWLVDYCIDNGYKFPDYVVHSMNPVGKLRIESYIENARKHAGV